MILEMINIPGGNFLMGSIENEYEQPVRQVNIKPFFLGKYVVTQEQYKEVTRPNRSHFKGAKHPVERISWNDAVEFCQKLFQKIGKNYRLPSEAEWEYTCRAGTQTRHYFGYDDSILKEHAWYCENSGNTTHPVGRKNPNNLGLYDMYGNVWEWCSDQWHEKYNNAPTDGSSWETDTMDNRRPLRGGAWGEPIFECRSANRVGSDPDSRDSFVSFRLALSL